MKKRLVTSALPYVNNIPHLGNLIQVLSADVFARFCRQRAYETLYICGSDEYGTATETRALEENISPKELCDRYYTIHKEIYEWFHIEFDLFGRTSTEQQTTIVQDIYQKIKRNGYIEQKKVMQTYCKDCSRFLADRYVHGNCPHCKSGNARGDQCENCGRMLDPTELENPRCGICGAEPEQRETEHLFIDLPALRPKLEDWLDKASVRGRWSYNAVQMTKSWIRDGLKQRCITRDLSWGVPVPDMPGKVFYVWFDAPIGYISITANLKENWQEWWKNPDEVELFQFIGKDNIPFHTVLFPSSQLASQGKEGKPWTMLHHMSSSEYLNYEKGKFSKTRGVGIFGNDCQNTGIPADVWRFYLYYNRPEKSDYEFTWAEFQSLLNRELIGNLGNLINRTLTFLQRFFSGKLLPVSQTRAQDGIGNFLDKVHEMQNRITEKLEWSQIKDALHLIMEMADLGNKLFQEKEPWALVKTDPKQTQGWISALVYLIHDLAICLHPYIPQTAKKIMGFLSLAEDSTCFAWSSLGAYEHLNADHPLPKPEILFQQLEDEEMLALQKRFGGTQDDPLTEKNGKAGDTKSSQESEAFAMSVDLCVGKIIAIEQHPDAERLFVEKIDCGEAEPRTIVSGLAEHYTKEELLGKNVIVVRNLKPAKLRGVQSMGMILAAEPKKEDMEQAKATGLPLVEVLHPEGEPGQRVVVRGFEKLPIPQKAIRVEQFFLATLSLQDGKLVLQNTNGQDFPLSVLTETEMLQDIYSVKLRLGNVG